MVVTPPKSILKMKKYADRTNAGQIVLSYNPDNLPTAVEFMASQSPEERERIASHRGCTVAHHPLGAHPKDNSGRHMFAPLEKRVTALEDRLNGMSDAICETYQIKSDDEPMIEAEVKKEGEEDDALWTPVGLPKQNKVLCTGRICNEAHEGKINRTSIRLEGSRQHSSGSRIALDLDGLDDPTQTQDYSFFPGQIVAVEGTNSWGRTMRASRVLEGAAPPAETMPAEELLEYHYGTEGQDGAPLSIMSLCGPFTTRDNLDYDPLVDAMVEISKARPDVVILCGPFVDGRHPLVAGGAPTIADENGNETKVSGDYLFAAKVSELLGEMYENDPQMKTQFVLVPSTEDAFVDAVYPQPPFQDRLNIKVPKEAKGEFGDLGLRYVEVAEREDEKQGTRAKRVHCVSNPCTLRINDVTVGVTSTDVLFHIASEEINANLAPGTRLSRIATHLVAQRSYYPLFPAAKGASLDLSQSKGWEMPVVPDVLVVPSKLASFARRVMDGTVVVNPGELAKGAAGGTFATIDVHPIKREILEEGIKAGVDMGKGVSDRVRVDIKRI